MPQPILVELMTVIFFTINNTFTSKSTYPYVSRRRTRGRKKLEGGAADLVLDLEGMKHQTMGVVPEEAKRR
jgi:hypothetical protein